VIAIELKNLSKFYFENPSLKHYLIYKVLTKFKLKSKKNFVLEDINLIIPKGNVVGIIGDNGAGKSTLLQIISGVMKPSSGSIKVNGKISALLELGSGFNPDFNGIENIHLYSSIIGIKKNHLNKLIKDIINFADIGDFITKPVKTYSTGMKMRLAFSVATCFNPEIFIIDEALSVGDANFAHKSFNRIMELKQQGTTILFCSHSLYQIEAICDKAIWINEGKIISQGVPSDVTTSYKSNNFKSTKPKFQFESSQARMTDIEVYSNGIPIVSNTKINSLEDELKIIVKFYYERIEPTLAISFSDENGRIITSFGSKNDHYRPRINKNNTGIFKICIPNIQLLKGIYLVNINLMCNESVINYDAVKSVFVLHVVQTTLEQGICHIPHKWID
jgi:lipopolysaccharide transport system ATP-binding protein